MKKYKILVASAIVLVFILMLIYTYDNEGKTRPQELTGVFPLTMLCISLVVNVFNFKNNVLNVEKIAIITTAILLPVLYTINVFIFEKSNMNKVLIPMYFLIVLFSYLYLIIINTKRNDKLDELSCKKV